MRPSLGKSIERSDWSKKRAQSTMSGIAYCGSSSGTSNSVQPHEFLQNSASSSRLTWMRFFLAVSSGSFACARRSAARSHFHLRECRESAERRQVHIIKSPEKSAKRAHSTWIQSEKSAEPFSTSAPAPF